MTFPISITALDQPPRSRRPIASSQASASAWEFYPMRTSTPSSGYNSTSSVISRNSSFNSKNSKRITSTSTNDSAYSDVYSTIDEFEELSELPEVFEDSNPGPQVPKNCSHAKTASSTSTLAANLSNSGTLRRSQELGLPPKPAPPLPPRLSQSRPPARPPYPSTHAKQNSI